MKPGKIKDIMDLARRARSKNFVFNPCFVGAPGLGKTEIIQEWAKENSLPFIVITSALYEAPDIKGFPVVTVDENGRQRQTTAIPDYWPSSGEGVIILEEVNRGQASVTNCFMSLLDKRRGFDGYELPKGWLVASCINPENGSCDVNNMDSALKDRFEFFNVTYDKHSFLEFMKDVGWNQTVIDFVESGAWSYTLPENISETAIGAKYISPRTISKLNAAVNSDILPEDELMVFESILGTNFGSAFYKFKHDESPITYTDLINNKKAALKKLVRFSDPNNYKSGYISITIRSILEEAGDMPGKSKDGITDELVAEILEAIPAEQGQVLVSQLEYKRDPERAKNYDLLSKLFDKYPKIKEKFVLTANKKAKV
jgi:hypothetical protein